MPRKPRNKAKNQPHHVMSHSIPELDLFRFDCDKEVYLKLMKTATTVYRVTIISYCLMDNHVHMLIDPNGADIGDFMKNINNPYARYYNGVYERRGHLYADRYKNIVIKSETQLLRTSTYIHNNAKDLLWKGYKSIEDYPYSSIKDFTDPKNGRGIADPTRLFKFMNGESAKTRNHYKVLLEIHSEGHEKFAKEVEEAFKKGGYISEKKAVVRNAEPMRVLSALAEVLEQIEPELPLVKYRRSEKNFKCLAVISLRIFCTMTLKDITEIFKGYTVSGIGFLSKVGLDILVERKLYNRLAQILS